MARKDDARYHSANEPYSNCIHRVSLIGCMIGGDKYSRRQKQRQRGGAGEGRGLDGKIFSVFRNTRNCCFRQKIPPFVALLACVEAFPVGGCPQHREISMVVFSEEQYVTFRRIEYLGKCAHFDIFAEPPFSVV
jgi:hypothetical protein